ncbi:hypothetical protein [uncultured Gimesia sp.]|uniref:hypothetical protein n=1 Tax=uncultured Gimesia sp. TaxID=1678688 RepID=UPI0030DA4868|tara:strand:+ start:108994 stop:113007 length:4014 start_codon:yes stop_codon:yes gene_type:complete
MDGQLDHFVNELKHQLNQLDRRIRSLALLRGLGFIVLVLICLVTLQISLDFLFSLGTMARIVLSSLSVTVLVACVWFAMLRRVFHKRTPVELAAIVEESQSDLNERLTSVLELSTAQNESSSVVMRERLAKETIASLTTFNISDTVPSDRAMRFIMSAGIAILIFLTPLLIWPDAYRLLLSRSVIPWGNFATVSSLYFEVQPGDETVARGKDLQIVATPHWHTKQPGTIDEVWIEWEDAKGEQFTRRMDLDPEAGHYMTQFSRLLTGFQYKITTDHSRSKQYAIQISEPPSITDTQLIIVPPEYTQHKQQELTVLPSEINVLEQSQLTINLTFDRPVTEATLQYQLYASGTESKERPPVEQKEFVLSDDLLTARLELPVHKKSFLFHIALTGQQGNLKTQTSEHLVKVMLDRAPEIELSIYDQPEFFKPDESLTVPVEVIDDFSIAELEIHVKKLDEKATITKVPVELLGVSSVAYEFKIPLSDLQAQQADIFTYRVRAVDNRAVPSPNVAWSTPRVFGIDKNAEQQLSAGVISRQQKLRDELKKIQQDYKEHQQKVDQKIADLKKLKEQDKLAAGDQIELQKMTQVERKLAQQLENVANEFLQLPLYQKLAEKTQSVARTDFVKNHDTLKSAAGSETVKQAKHDLKPVPPTMTATEKKLGDLVQQYEKLVELENDLLNLNRLAEETNHLADDLLSFNDKLESATQQPQAQADNKQPPAGEKNKQDPKSPEQQKDQPHQNLTPEMEKELANLQAELKHRQSSLAKDLDKLLERRPELVDAARNHQLKQLNSLVNQTSQLIEPQRQLADAIQQQAPVAASRPATAEPAQQSAPQEPMPAGQAPPAANGNEAPTAAANAANAEPATNTQPAETNMSREKSQAKAEPAKPESVRNLLRQQQMLAQAAANLALETAQQFGPESEPTRKATQLAEEAIKAQQAANSGKLHEASQAANRAAKMAEAIIQAHQSKKDEQTERDAFLEQAEQMANLQRELAGKMAQASNSEAMRQEALKNSQEALARQTQALTQQLAETSEKLETDPISLKKESQQAERTQEKTAKAGQAMQKAVEGLSEENLSLAAEQARQAARELQEASRKAQQAGRKSQKESPVPEKVGDQVTDAARQLRNAQKQLEQTPEFKNAGDQTMAQEKQTAPRDANSDPKQAKAADQKQGESQGKDQNSQAKAEPGDAGQSQEEQASQNSKNQSQQSEKGKPSASKKAAESLKRAAESLSQAATELKSKSQQGSDPGKGQQSQTASKNMAPGKGQGESEGGGAKSSVDFTQLKTKLKTMSSRNWGELPGNLDTEILQGSRSRTDPEYARLIKHYFEAIAKSKSDSK